jgi:L-gulonate 3-dehydrogenase
MNLPVPKKVGVVGTGVIGRGWIKVFARAGCSVAVYDQDPTQADKAIEWFTRDLEADVALGSLSTEAAQRQLSSVVTYKDLSSGFRDVEYVQESGPENLEVKRRIMEALDPIVGRSAIIGSSTSALDVNEFVTGLKGGDRIITAHPINPAYLHPAIEVFPSRGVPSGTVERALRILRAVGMRPVLMRKFINGYISARVQSALMREAIHLVLSGVATVDGVDTMVRDGLGQRWAFLGPFGVNHTNADGGIREYYSRYRQTYLEIMRELDNSVPAFDERMIEEVAKQVDAMNDGATVAELGRWRDEQVIKLREIKAANAGPADKTRCA